MRLWVGPAHDLPLHHLGRDGLARLLEVQRARQLVLELPFEPRDRPVLMRGAHGLVLASRPAHRQLSVTRLARATSRLEGRDALGRRSRADEPLAEASSQPGRMLPPRRDVDGHWLIRDVVHPGVVDLKELAVVALLATPGPKPQGLNRLLEPC